jgi:hypothetical protein
VDAAQRDNNSKIMHMVISDLRHYGVELVNGSVWVYKTPQGKVDDYVKSCRHALGAKISELRSTWNSIPLFLAEDSGVMSSEGGRILITVIENLRRKTIVYFVLNSSQAARHLKSASMELFGRWSDKTAEDLSFISIKIENLEHEIRKIGFIASSLLHLNECIHKVAQSNASSVQGAYSNLDLPMSERWYLWGDVEEEVEGRRDSIRSSERYRMGLDDSDPLGVKEGFYWRELRNEPYKFDTLYPDSPYPYRSAIWGTP